MNASKIEALPLSERKGSLLGTILMVVGSSVGVGILPLPILTGQAGSLPTLACFIACCVFMSTTALLILESCLIFSGNKNFISLSRVSLNKTGQAAVFLSFLFLFYSVITAYLAKGGELTTSLLQAQTQIALPLSTGAILLAILSGSLIFFGPFLVDHLNRIFMYGFFATYLFITFSGFEYFQVENIQHSDWSLSISILPFVITSFGYHNMVPSIHEYLGGNKQKLYLTILISGVILFAIYNFWVFLFHGIVPLKGEVSILNSYAKGEIVTQPLSQLIRSPAIQFCAEYLAFFAIITSILGQGLSIIDFLADGFRIEKTPMARFLLCLLLFIPTLFFSQFIPGVFFKALELVGGIAAMVIFGIIPALMCWTNRYRRPELQNFVKPLVPGGKPMLIAVIALASSMIGYELIKNFNPF